MGFIPTLGAVAKGVKVVERHFPLDKSLKGKVVDTEGIPSSISLFGIFVVLGAWAMPTNSH